MPILSVRPAKGYFFLVCMKCYKVLGVIKPGGGIMHNEEESDCECVWRCCKHSEKTPHAPHLGYRRANQVDVEKWEREHPDQKTREAVKLTEDISVNAKNGWRLVVLFNHDCDSIVVNVPKALINEIFRKTWEIQDGYGKAGFTPSQGWDWSGIRDSSKFARAVMEANVIQMLQDSGIEVVQITRRF